MRVWLVLSLLAACNRDSTTDNESDMAVSGEDMAVCAVGALDCDQNSGNGCEIDGQTDPKNCGACGNVCDDGDPCTSNECVAGTCQPKILANCCGNILKSLEFLTTASVGTCGTIHDANDNDFDIPCGTMRVGGGNSALQPIVVPEGIDLFFDVEPFSCEGSTFKLGPRASGEGCTAPGCPFGGGMPFMLQGMDYCAYTTFTNPAVTGTVNGTDATLNISTETKVYKSTCPAPANTLVATVQTQMVSRTATVSMTGAKPTGVAQSRVFCGLCRDDDATQAFEPLTSPPQFCFEQGVASATKTCSGEFEACMQRSNGAFGPTGGANKVITINGSPPLLSTIFRPTVVGAVFCVATAGNLTADTTSDVPGPGYVALVGKTRPVPAPSGLCGNGMINGDEACDGTTNCAPPNHCNAVCSACLPPL
jgi:hypothetical protein